MFKKTKSKIGRDLSLVFALVMGLLPFQALPTYAGSNGQQLIINVCGASSLTIQGFNASGKFVGVSFPSNSGACVAQKISGWWWKDSTHVTAYYPGGRQNTIFFSVPTRQASDWVSVNMPPPPPIGETYVARAKVWVDKAVKYNQSKTANPDGSSASNTTGYRTDCSGLVSLAWGLEAKGKGVPDTVALTNYARTLNSKDELLAGDAINNRKTGNDGHVVLFVRWVDKNTGKFIAYEENGYYGKTVQTTLTLESTKTGWNIKEQGLGPWYLERKK